MQQQPNQMALSIIRGQKCKPDQDIQNNNEQKITIPKRENLKEFKDTGYQEFHRQCLMVKHKQASILEFCTNKKCKQPSRFLCELCSNDGLHLSDIPYKPPLILKQLQVSERIKQNHNKLVQIYKTNTNIVDNILLKFKLQVDKLYSNIAHLARQAKFSDLLDKINQLNKILIGEQKFASLEGNHLYKLISEQPENYLCEEFGDMIRGFNQIQKEIYNLSQISLEIPNVIKDLMKVKNMEYSQEMNSDEIIAEARAAIQSGQLEQAIEMLNDHLEESRSQQKESEIRNTLGYGYYKQQSYEKAICQYQKAIISSKTEANNYQYYYYIGKCQFKSYLTYADQIKMENRQEFCDHFLATFQVTMQLNPQFNGSYIQISKINKNLGQSDEQIKVLLQGLQENKNDYKLALSLGEVKFLLKQYNEALNYIKQALKLKEFDLKLTQPEYMFNKFNPIFAKGVILCELGFYKESLQILSQVIKYNKYNDEAHYYICLCLCKLKEFNQAKNILQQLLYKSSDPRYLQLIALITSEFDNRNDHR